MEDYLKEQFGFREVLPSAWFNSLEEYFADDRGEFDCGQGYYEDEVSFNVFYEGKCYLIQMSGEVGSAKQDYGDRLYWIERVVDVKVTEIPQPDIMLQLKHTYVLALDEVEKSAVERFFSSKNIHWNVI